MMQDYIASFCSSANCLSLSARFLCNRWAFSINCSARMKLAPCSERRRPAQKLKPAAHPPAPPAGTPRHSLPHDTWPDLGPGSPPAAQRPCPLLARTAAAPLGAPTRTYNSTGDKTVVYSWTLPFGTRSRAVLGLTQSWTVRQLRSDQVLYWRAQPQHHRVRLCTRSAHSPFNLQMLKCEIGSWLRKGGHVAVLIQALYWGPGSCAAPVPLSVRCVAANEGFARGRGTKLFNSRAHLVGEVVLYIHPQIGVSRQLIPVVGPVSQAACGLLLLPILVQLHADDVGHCLSLAQQRTSSGTRWHGAKCMLIEIVGGDFVKLYLRFNILLIFLVTVPHLALKWDRRK